MFGLTVERFCSCQWSVQARAVGAIALALEVIWKYRCIIYDLDRWSSTSPASLQLNSLNRNSQRNFTWIRMSTITETIKKQFTCTFPSCYIFFFKYMLDEKNIFSVEAISYHLGLINRLLHVLLVSKQLCSVLQR